MEAEEELPIIDRGIIEDDFMNDLGQLREVFDHFLIRYEQQLSTVEQAICREDSDRLAHAATELKGDLLHIGAAAAAESARIVANYAREKNLLKAKHACGHLENELDRLLPAYENYLAQEADFRNL